MFLTHGGQSLLLLGLIDTLLALLVNVLVFLWGVSAAFCQVPVPGLI